ncbi:hypothetical protein QBC43DRAFT_40063 [Cladorrhinum sp. PSN259]|nr:hypothetical protein QBC43DRAFT_40063 [Cladorrhinum sp. PSN259]
MDALAALGLAAAVVQFTDFGVRLLTDSVHVYRSATGQTSQHVELGAICDDLSQLAKRIELQSSTYNGVKRKLTEAEEDLLRLAQKCQNITSELSNSLSRLRASRGSTGKINLVKESVAVALRTYQSKEQIASLRGSLHDIRQQMMMASLSILWERSESNTDSLSQISLQQAGMMDALNRIDHVTRSLSPKVVQIAQTVTDIAGGHSPEASFVKAIWNSSWTPNGRAADIMKRAGGAIGLTNQEEGHRKFDEKQIDEFCTLSILDSLRFEAFDFRETAIPEAYQRTFEWVFQDSESAPRDARWDDFDKWLQAPQGDIYWITGKPGAGKSTLMKYLIHHLTTKKRLESWSNPLPLIISSFYFWNAGSAKQKSQQGLLQTLLYQFLCEMPHLTPKICPRRWALLKIFDRNALRVAPSWTMDEVLESISIFNKLYVGKEFRLALFIDGLDEFDGDYNNLIKMVNVFHSCVGVKVCVSSRPENAFVDAYRGNPGLQVQTLTRRDMEIYVRGHFGANTAFLELQKASSRDADALLKQIVIKSEGIFLWVSLVVATLLEELTEGDILAMQDLQNALDELPKDLLELYRQIWTRIKPRHAPQSSKMFQILEASEDPVDVVTLWLAENQGPLDFDMRTLTVDRKDYITQLMTRRLSSRTRGLLEISSDGNVDYLHKSVKDWINMIWSEVCAMGPPEFDPNFALLVTETVKGLSVGLSVPEAQKRLRYAAEVKDKESSVTVLVTCLDSLHDLLTDHVGNNYFHKFQQYPSRQRWIVHGQPAYPMVCLAAQYSVLPYVRAKVLSLPNIFQQMYADSVSIIVCAVFGSLYFDLGLEDPDSKTVFPLDLPSPGPLSRRYELVRVLLHSGALGPPSLYIRKAPTRRELYGQRIRWHPRAMHHGWGVYKRLINRPGNQSQQFTTLDGQQRDDYWDAVQKLFEECPDFGRWGGVIGLMKRAVNHATMNFG